MIQRDTIFITASLFFKNNDRALKAQGFYTFRDPKNYNHKISVEEESFLISSIFNNYKKTKEWVLNNSSCQESILEVSQGHAWLIYLDGSEKYIGKWVEVEQDKINNYSGWTKFNNKYYTAIKD